MKSYVIVLSAALLAACAAQPDAPSGRVQVSREVRDQCQREAALMYPVALKINPAPAGPAAPTPSAYAPAPPQPEDANVKERTDMIAACLRAKASEKK
jgi:hypothetical protein